jgi:hypothetical protein
VTRPEAGKEIANGSPGKVPRAGDEYDYLLKVELIGVEPALPLHLLPRLQVHHPGAYKQCCIWTVMSNKSFQDMDVNTSKSVSILMFLSIFKWPRVVITLLNYFQIVGIKVVVPEWLSGMTRNHVGSARAGSNPADHVFFSPIQT